MSIDTIDQQYNYTNISTATTTAAIKTGSGLLKAIVINSIGATATITVYDSLTGSGTKIASISGTLALGDIQYGVLFTTGLSVVTTGGTPPDITLVWV